MHRFRFHFNTQYAIELREAINDRQKQSMVNIHKDRQIKGDYFAWDRTCAAMDRLEDTLEYFNNIELGNCSSVRTAFDFYDFINNSYIVIDCIKTIGQIFRIDEQLIENIEKSTSVFGKTLSESCTDGRYFEYIRSLCSVHPLCTNHQKEFLNGSAFHCCPFVVWRDSPACISRNDADLMACIYPSSNGKQPIYLSLYVSQFERYLTEWIDLIPRIIEAKNRYTDREYNRLSREPVKSHNECECDIVKYLKYLKGEYVKRLDYGSDYEFDSYIKYFTITLTDPRNTIFLEKYQNAVIYSLGFLRNELQHMTCEGFLNSGIAHREVGVETTLFDSLSYISPGDGAFSRYGYNIQKIFYLDTAVYYSEFDKIYARELLNAPMELINQYVHFTNTEPDEERCVLVQLALYLEALTRKSLLNMNIPNLPMYRVQLLTDEEYSSLFVERARNDASISDGADFEKLIREYEPQSDFEYPEIFR